MFISFLPQVHWRTRVDPRPMHFTTTPHPLLPLGSSRAQPLLFILVDSKKTKTFLIDKFPLKGKRVYPG
jgi:hypothetical protein